MKWGIKGFEWTCKVLSPGQAHLNPYYQFLLQVIQSVYVWSGPSPLSRSPGPQPHLGFPSSCNKCWADSHIWVQDTVLCAWCKAWPVVPNAHLCSWFLDIWLPGSLHPCYSALTLATQDESFRFRQFLTDWAYPLLCVNFSSSTSPRPAFPRKGFLVPGVFGDSSGSQIALQSKILGVAGSQTHSVFISCSCCDKLSQTWWLKRTN